MIKIWCHAKCYDGFAHPDAQFAMSFGVKAGSNIYSLRSSEESGFDVSEVAKVYGGGGHQSAAAFRSERILDILTPRDGSRDTV